MFLGASLLVLLLLVCFLQPARTVHQQNTLAAMLHEAQSYYIIFGAFLLACAAIVWIQSRGEAAAKTSPAFKTFQRSYLLVFFLASLADWLQVCCEL